MPIRVEVAAGQQFCSITLGNDSVHPVTVQVRGFGWTRDELGNDSLDPQSGPLVNPAIAVIAGGQSRLVRCSLPAAARDGAGVEEQWRLIVDELPVQTGDRSAGTVQTLLRLSIPVFRTPSGSAARLDWSTAALAGGGTGLRIANSGTRHARVSRLAVRFADGGETKLERSFYVLPAGAMLVPLPTAGSRVVDVTAETDFGAVAVTPQNVATRAGSRTALPAAASVPR